MQKLITLFLLFSAFNLSAQNTRMKTAPQVGETYSVLLSDSTVKHGLYTCHFENKLLAEGRYENGKRVGEWKFYGFDQKLAQTYNYRKQELTYTTAVTGDLQYLVIYGQDTVLTTLDSKAEPIGGDMTVARFLRSSIQYPERARAMGIEGTVIVLVTVDETGTPIHHRCTKRIGGGCDEEAIRGLKRMPVLWVPSKKDGKAVKSIIPYPVQFKLL